MKQKSAATVSVAGDNKQSNRKERRIASIIVSVILICGIGFGIYGLIQSSLKDNQIAGLKEQFSKYIEENGKGEIEIAPIGQRTPGYLHLDEFGIKVVVPDDILVTSFEYSIGDYGLARTDVEDLGTYEIWVIPKDKNGLVNYSANTSPDYAIRISRYSKDSYACEVSCGKDIFTDDNYVFTISPQVSTIENYDGTIDEELNSIVGGFVSGQLSSGSGFFDKGNYSKI
ncbi:hypothetical protein IKD49_02955 [Candidatus Saccharibacteria bacterium]|nr:hypothetical protein [Candidatus Saccharibacteria bacterium]